MFEVIWGTNAGQHYGLSALSTFPRLYTFRKYGSSTTEKLLPQENAHVDHAIYYYGDVFSVVHPLTSVLGK